MTFPGSALGRLAVGDTFVTPPVSGSSKLALFISWCPSPNIKNRIERERERERREKRERLRLVDSLYYLSIKLSLNDNLYICWGNKQEYMHQSLYPVNSNFQ